MHSPLCSHGFWTQGFITQRGALLVSSKAIELVEVPASEVCVIVFSITSAVEKMLLLLEDSKPLTVSVAVVSEKVSEGPEAFDVDADDTVLAISSEVACEEPNVAPAERDELLKLGDVIPILEALLALVETLPVTKLAPVMPPPTSRLEFVRTCRVEAGSLKLPALCPVDSPEVETVTISPAVFKVER